MWVDYESAVDRAKSLRPLVPEQWDVVPIGNEDDGYRLAIEHRESGRVAHLEDDDDVRRLLDLYIQQMERLSAAQ